MTSFNSHFKILNKSYEKIGNKTEKVSHLYLSLPSFLFQCFINVLPNFKIVSKVVSKRKKKQERLYCFGLLPARNNNKHKLSSTSSVIHICNTKERIII